MVKFVSHIPEFQRMQQTNQYYIPCNWHAVLAEDECHLLCTVTNTTHSATSCLQKRTRVPTNWIFKTNEDAARTATRALYIHQRSCWDFGTAGPTVFTILQCPVVQLSSKKSDVTSLSPSLPPSVVTSVESIKQLTPVWARNLVPSYKTVPKTGIKWTWGARTETARY
jgi:hypothetical protein